MNYFNAQTPKKQTRLKKKEELQEKRDLQKTLSNVFMTRWLSLGGELQFDANNRQVSTLVYLRVVGERAQWSVISDLLLQ
jgi:hypothetical protein